jgi:hypothetical protein
VRVTETEGKSALYDSVTGVAFGPVMETGDGIEFLMFVARETDDQDPRKIPAGELESLYARYRAEEWE